MSEISRDSVEKLLLQHQISCLYYGDCIDFPAGGSGVDKKSLRGGSLSTFYFSMALLLAHCGPIE